MIDPIRKSVVELADLLASLDSSGYLDQVERVACVVAEALRRGNQILVFGNGGSASDAQHIAGEFVGRFCGTRRPLPALALTADSAVLTCVANDFGFDEVFARQVDAFGRPGDVAWGISTSGRSENVIRAFAAAQRLALKTVLMTGGGGGPARELADLVLDVPASVTARIQEVHTLTLHAICAAVEAEIVRCQP